MESRAIGDKQRQKIALVLAIGIAVGVFTSLYFVGRDQTTSQPGQPRSPDSFAETAHYSGIPDNKKAVIRQSIAAFVEACPNIAKSAGSGEGLSAFYYPDGWEKTPAHLDVVLDFEQSSLNLMPQGLRDPQWGGHMEVGLSGGTRPGVQMHTPLAEWLCGVNVDEEVLRGQKREWNGKMMLKPIDAIKPGSF